ncbi:sushi domain-containing protein 1 isoform X1 [Takifugu flavidus]|uniref:sushi domain-containing protein 1 isoform X1 n=1 Tax=Takifugu flavidus TaxID=433684 RepID=UPI0025445875|nr:sushi domain-containing protein 1 isoform X1 [Takifugu flavidus]
MRNGTMEVLVLLCFTAGVLAGGHSQDMCTACHTNATCDEKLDGSGKVCNCKYGFVGNGRTICLDKDECQIGANRICGQSTTCHNTYGSYYCTCMSGYSPSNNMAVFIPNDGTHCQDVDECRIPGLCGDGAQCTNLPGSFECSCQLGYRVQNGKEPFVPRRENASCKVVDCGQPASAGGTVLLSATATTYSSVATFACDEGFMWRSGDNSSVCGADGLWSPASIKCEEVDCGPPPHPPHTHMVWNKSSRVGAEVFYQCNYGYHNVGEGNVSVCAAAGLWEKPSVVCQETSCGSPPVIESTEQMWNNSSTPGSTVLYFCKEGFHKKGGENVSVCNEKGQWSIPSLVCKEIFCGNPPIVPHTGQMWNGSSIPGSAVTYYCKIGFYHHEGTNMSLCTSEGYWTQPSISCKEVDCGVPPPVPYSVMQWNNVSTMGSQVVYKCISGYHNVGEGGSSICTASGEWADASLLCQEISCPDPVFKPHTETLWDGTAHVGSVVHYQCEEGFYTRGLKNTSECGANGLWEDVDLWCEEISCGPPPNLPHTNPLWDGSSRPGSVVLYECMAGFYLEAGTNMSTCSQSGEWGNVSVRCRAKCGPIPQLANSEVVWHNRSVVVHRCVPGYHSWRGSSTSVCGNSGLWLEATLTCIEIKPPITQLLIFNESCLRWRAEKYEAATEVYKVTYTGRRDYQRYFYDSRKRFLSSTADRLELCLNLLPVTNYSIAVTALTVGFTATITTNTSLPVPAAPAVYYREFETPVPTLKLRRSVSSLDAISFYQVFVLPAEGIVVFDCSDPSSDLKSSSLYIAAQINAKHVGTEMNFTVGDGFCYGGFLNVPLKNGRDYYIFLRAVSQWEMASKSACVLWAKVEGISYALKVSSLSAAASVGLGVLLIFGGYILTWFLKKT